MLKDISIWVTCCAFIIITTSLCTHPVSAAIECSNEQLDAVDEAFEDPILDVLETECDGELPPDFGSINLTPICSIQSCLDFIDTCLAIELPDCEVDGEKLAPEGICTNVAIVNEACDSINGDNNNTTTESPNNDPIIDGGNDNGDDNIADSDNPGDDNTNSGVAIRSGYFYYLTTTAMLLIALLLL